MRTRGLFKIYEEGGAGCSSAAREGDGGGVVIRVTPPVDTKPLSFLDMRTAPPPYFLSIS